LLFGSHVTLGGMAH